MTIQDYIKAYVKSPALRLGADEAAADIDAGGLEFITVTKEDIQDWPGASVIIQSTEGDRTVVLSQDETKDLFLHGNNINFFKPHPGGSITLPNGVLMLTQNSLNLSVNGSGYGGSDGQITLAVAGDGTVSSPIHGFGVDNGSVSMFQWGGTTNGSLINMGNGRNMSIGTGFLTITADIGLHLQTDSSDPNLNRFLIKNRNNTPGAITQIILGNEPNLDEFGGAPLPKSPAGLSVGTIWVDGTGDSASLRIVMEDPI